MSKLFIGLLFVFLDFTINIGTSKIGLIPDFIGYLFLLNGVGELSEQSNSFYKIKPAIAFMVFYSIILYAMDFIGLSVSLGMFTYLLGIISTALSLYILHGIVSGIMDIEAASQRDLNSKTLYSIWKVLAVVSILAYFLLLVPGINIIVIIMGFIVHICFLVYFNHSKNLYYSISN